MTADALKNNYLLPILLQNLRLTKGSNCYQHKLATTPDKYEALRNRITMLFDENSERCFYRGIRALMIREGLRISEKVIRRVSKAVPFSNLKKE
ncbi:hypothetical protein [Macellibacteroides fermentans]|uniref:hypothetical protein n=1 Tax=Macellibacteroides fermentans TaxID=879969 RepID=UPI00406C79F2